MVTAGLPVPAPGTVLPLLPRLLEPAAGLLAPVSCAAALAAGRRSPPTPARVTACASHHLRARQRATPAPVEHQTGQIRPPLGPSRRLGPLTSSLGRGHHAAGHPRRGPRAAVARTEGHPRLVALAGARASLTRGLRRPRSEARERCLAAAEREEGDREREERRTRTVELGRSRYIFDMEEAAAPLIAKSNGLRSFH
jgi:hypothetical protein